jgi:ATP-dependent RNA helicase DeaD
MSFEGLPRHIQDAFSQRGFTELTAVQQRVLDPALAGKDLRISSQTGSGKTAAVGILLAPLFAEAKSTGKPRALVICPTRELAQQVRSELSWVLAGGEGAETTRIGVVTGGTSMRDEMRTMSRGADLVVGTPGRLLDHLKRGTVVVEDIRAVVLDEADQMLDLGFREDLEAILEKLPKERQTHMMSATFSRPVLVLANRYQKNAVHLEATRLGAANVDIAHVAHLVKAEQRDDALVNLLLLAPDELTLVFVKTRIDATKVAHHLAKSGFSAAALHGDMEQRERTRVLDGFRQGQIKILVATDVAARGIDVLDITRVIQADLPGDPEALTHRSGRTGRAGKKGLNVMLVPMNAREQALRLLGRAKATVVWRPLPTADEIHASADARLEAQLIAPLGDEAPDFRQRRLAARLVRDVDPFTLVVRLLRFAGHDGPCAPKVLTVVEPPKMPAGGYPVTARVDRARPPWKRKTGPYAGPKPGPNRGPQR